MVEKEKRGSTGLALKAGFWYVISNFLVKGISFITTPIFSRLMSEADYGGFPNFAGCRSPFFVITGAELYSTLNRAYYDYKDDYNKYVSSVTILGFCITILCYALFLLCGDFIYSIVAIPAEYVHVLFLNMLLLSGKEIFLAREKTLYRYKRVAAVSAVYLVIPTLIAVLCVIFAGEAQRLSARIYGFYIPAAILALYCTMDVLRRGRTVKWKYCKYALKLSLPLLVHYLTAYLLSSSNTIVTKSILGAEAAAIVSITTSAVHILTILLQAVSGAVTTWLMDNLEQKAFAALRRNLLIYSACICFVAVGVMLLGPEVVWVLGGTKYAQAVTLLPGMVTAVTIQSVTTVFTIILTYKKRVLGAAVCTAVIAGISIVAKILMLPQYGIEILPWINIAAYGVLFVCDYLLVRRSGYGNVINMRGFCGCILLLGLMTVVSGYLYTNMMLRYAVVAFVGAAALMAMYRKRELLIGLLRKKKK